MNRTALALVIALAVPLTAASAASADATADSLAELRAIAGPQLSVLEASGQPTLRFLAGRLTVAPTTDVRAAAVRFLDRHGAALGRTAGATLDFDREVPLTSGTVLRYRERIAGIPVVNGEVTLRFDRDGLVRVVNSGLAPFARVADATPRIGSADALAEVLELPGLVAPADPDAVWAGLVYFPAGGEARLAWQIETGRVPALAANWVTWVDAHTGEVLARRNRVWFDKLANVWEQNPVATPDLQQVTLSDLPDWTADPYYLTGELILSRNCIDEHALTTLTYSGMTFHVHICTEEQVAAGDASHDFLFTDNTDTAPEDLFAEAAMFYHANKVYRFFQSLGFTHLHEMPLRATVNFRIPVDLAAGIDLANATNPDGTLFPMDNAMFMPAGDASMFIPRDSDSIVFGQGTAADFSYDGDVVYHEFTHAVIGSTSNLESATVDDEGLDIGPGALNEGYADTFAMFLTGNAAMGEYAGRNVTGGGPIRNLANDNACPGDMIGEVHQDSLPWSSAAWTLYDALGDEIVQPYYDAMVSLVSTADFAVATHDTLAELESQLGADVAATARAEYTRRNIVDCSRVLPGGGAPFPLLMGEGTGTVGLSPYVPGYAMFHIALPAGQRQVRVTFTATSGGIMGIGGTPTPYVLFKKGPDKLALSYFGTTVNSNADYEVTATSPTSGSYEAVYCETGGEIAAGDYWAMIANKGGGSMQMTQISVRYGAGVPDVPCLDTGGGDAGDGGTDVPADVPSDAGDTADAPPAACDPTACTASCQALGQSGGDCRDSGGTTQCVCTSSSGGGCGCSTAGSGGAPGTWLALFAAAALLLRRRRG